MTSGSPDYYNPHAQMASILTKLDTSIVQLMLVVGGLKTGGDLLNKLDALDGKADGKLDLSKLTADATGLLAKLGILDTDLKTGGDLINALDALDGTMDGVITLAELNSAQCEMLGKLTGIDTSVQTGGNLINKLDALDGTMDGRLTLTQLNTEALVPNRPRYGKAERLWDQATVLADDETEIGSVSGVGMIYGGVILLDYDSAQDEGTPRLYVDNVRIADLDFNALAKYCLVREHSYPLYLCRKDETNHVYAVGVSRGITFETGFRITYDENNGTTPIVYCRIIYAKIS